MTMNKEELMNVYDDDPFFDDLGEGYNPVND